MKGPGKLLKIIFKQKWLNPREGQPAHATEASGSGGRKGNEGKRCRALILSQNISPCGHVENALFSAKPNPLPFSSGWASAPPAQALDSHGQCLPPRGTVTQGWKHTCSWQLLPCEGVPSPSLLLHQAKCSPTLPAVHCCYLHFRKDRHWRGWGKEREVNSHVPCPSAHIKLTKSNPIKIKYELDQFSRVKLVCEG